jgi:hypothetical protein
VSCTNTPQYKHYDFYDSQGKGYDSYDDYCNVTINELKPPIILIGKHESTMFDGLWGITVIDSEKRIVSFGDLSSLANNIGSSHNINDTIVR